MLLTFELINNSILFSDKSRFRLEHCYDLENLCFNRLSLFKGKKHDVSVSISVLCMQIKMVIGVCLKVRMK